MVKNLAFDKLIGIRLGPYRLERLLEQGAWGPTFLARTDAATATYLVRLLPGPGNLTAEEHEVYLQQFQHLAHQLTTLQHPHILPVLDYGTEHSIPFLVSPHLPMRSLRTRLERGPLDVFTAGRYLDQITAALECAHEHAVLHGTLTVDCIFIRLDGQLLVTDFGLMSLMGTNRTDAQRELLTQRSEACAPEQLLGKSVGPTIDVYALGATLYHMLTGAPIFRGSTPNQIAQQHIYMTVPPLTLWRSDLPSGLYSLLARALAKEPGQRYPQPGAFANAYHRLIAPDNHTRVPFVMTSSSSSPVKQPSSAGAPVGDSPVSEFGRGFTPPSINGLERSEHPPFLPQAAFPDSLGNREERYHTLSQRLQRRQLRHGRRNVLLALLVLLVVTSSVLGITFFSRQGNASPHISGQVTFFDDPHGPAGHTNALSVITEGLPTPATGSHYAAWFIDESSEQLTPLGLLTITGQRGTLHYFGASSPGQPEPNLLATSDKLEITLEQGTVKLPTGKVVLVGTFPLKSEQHLQHLLVRFPETPGKIGFLVGALGQIRVLNIQADVLQSLVSSNDPQLTQCVAQSLLDVIEGKHGAHYQPLAVSCVQEHVGAMGDGFGLLGKGYLDGATQHAGFALSLPDATSAMRVHGKLMAIALANIKTWLTTIDQDLLQLRSNPTDLSRVPEIVTLADVAYHGMDSNGDGQIDPVTGEAGTITAYLQGQLMVTLSLTSTN